MTAPAHTLPPPVPHAGAPHAGVRWVAVTTTPGVAPGPACTPELAAWLVNEGLAVAVTREGVAGWLLHLPGPRPARRAAVRGLASPAGCPRTTPSPSVER